MALQHAVELVSPWPGNDLGAEANRLVGAEWDKARGEAPSRVADLMDKYEGEQIYENAVSALAAMPAAGQACAQASPDRRQGGPELPRLVTRSAMLEGVALEQDHEAAAS
ncbi:hypothetical protein [Nonomuraea sp. NPDC049400]|uniref:hypothetical protein n=1 Tax=Nonomuraea sp. NPDC049400 TaxID=3364352 RepID=UPI0037B4B076